MTILKSAFISPSFACLSCLQCTSTAKPPMRPPSRSYAQLHSSRKDTNGPSDEPHLWPEPIPPQRIPTPYQILRHSKDDVYTKSYFHKLVKLYHPDRINHLSSVSSDATVQDLSSVPRHVLLERYRLIITAHTILSDPIKRSAYDRFGAGWVGNANSGASSTATKSSWYYPYDQSPGKRKAWKPGEDPMANATWEDWEKWHDKNNPDREPQNPVFVSNGAFASFIIAFAAVGAIMQSSRADSFQEKIVELRDQAHRESNKDLRQIREIGRAAQDQEDSIRHWLMLRDSQTTDKESLRRLLPRQDVCESGAVTKSEH